MPFFFSGLKLIVLCPPRGAYTIYFDLPIELHEEGESFCNGTKISLMENGGNCARIVSRVQKNLINEHMKIIK